MNTRDWLPPAILVGAVALGLHLRSRQSETDPSETAEPMPPEGTERVWTDAAGSQLNRVFEGGQWVTQVPVTPPERDEFDRVIPKPLDYSHTPKVDPWPYPNGLAPYVEQIYAGKGVRWRFGDNAARLRMSPGAPVLPLFMGRDGLYHWPKLVHADEIRDRPGFFPPDSTDLVPMGSVVPDQSVSGWFFAVRLPSGPRPDFGLPWQYGDSTDPMFGSVGTRLTPAMSHALLEALIRPRIPTRTAFRPSPSQGWTRNGWWGWVHPTEIKVGEGAARTIPRNATP